MPAGKVVGDEIEDQADAAGMGLAYESPGVVVGAKARVDRAVVDDVVAMEISRVTRAFEKRREPEAVDPQVLEGVQALGDALEVADAVAIGIAEGGDPEVIDDGVLVPVLSLGLEA